MLFIGFLLKKEENKQSKTMVAILKALVPNQIMELLMKLLTMDLIMTKMNIS